MRKVTRFLAIALAVLAIATPVSAKFNVRPGWVKAYVNTASSAQLANLVAGTNSELLWVYTTEAKAVVYTPSMATLSSVATQMGLRATAAKDISELATVNGLVFNPREIVPQPDDIREYRSSDPGLYLLHFAVNPDPGYVTQLAGMGITVVAQAGGNTAVVMAKPVNIGSVDALPWLAYRGFLQPWMKGDHLADPERYYSVLLTVAPGAPNRERIAHDLSLPAFATDPTGLCFLGTDLAAMFSHPLVLLVHVAPSLVDVAGVLPGQAPAGSEITVNTANSLQIDELRIGGVTAPFTRLDHFRLRATVPHGLPIGPADVLALRFDGWRQVLPSRVDFGFHVAESYGRTIFTRGDVITVTDIPTVILPPAPQYSMQWWTPQGELRRERDDAVGTVLFFGAQGFLNATSFGTPRRYDARLEMAGDGPDLLKDALGVTMRRDGASFVIVGNELRSFSAGGELQEKATLPGTRSVDVDVDQCTLVLSTIEGLKLYDGCRMALLGTIRGGDWTDARFTRDGTILASSRGDEAVYRLSRAGAVVAKTLLSDASIAFSPDGSFAWLAAADRVYRFDLTTNQRSDAFQTVDRSIRNLTVYGEWTAGRGEAAYDDEIVIDSVTGFDGIPGTPVTITGHAFIAGASVTIGGLPVPAPNVGETKITLVMPSGTKITREVVVTNPNGERASYVARKGKRRAV
jgi:hypothetical protein